MAVRYVCDLPRLSPNSASMRDLLWLIVKQRVNYKVLLWVFNVLYGDSAEYLQELFRDSEPITT